VKSHCLSRTLAGLLTFVAVFLLPCDVSAQIQEAPVRYDEDLLPASFHADRRALVRAALPEDALAVFFSSPVRMREHDVKYRYRQDSNLYYLTGTHEPESILLLIPGGFVVDDLEVFEILFVPQRNPTREMWDGRLFGPERARIELGVEMALPNDRFEAVATEVFSQRRIFHLPLPRGVIAGSRLDRQLEFLRRHLGDDNDGATLRRTLTELRTIKTDEELRLLRRAIGITSDAHREIMATIRPGMFEYEVEALVEFTFRRNGAAYAGFPSIVASGENSIILHYDTNRRRMEDGDVVVIDIGAEYHGYSADITRTLPVNGRFTEEQRLIYELVLEAQNAGIEAAKAGNNFADPGRAALARITEGLRALGIARDDRHVRRLFPHGTSHYLGLMVHDVGTGGPLLPGTVITVEPGIYIAPHDDIDPRWWNIGVRIEDDILITEDGPVVLSDGSPRTVAEIEALMSGGSPAADAARE
jgi:Xaa-Pro aminopeptidase